MISLLALTTVVVIFKVSHTVSLICPVHNRILFFLFWYADLIVFAV